MPGIYLSNPPAMETDSKTATSQEAPAVTGGIITLPDDFHVGPETCGFTSGSTSTFYFYYTLPFSFSYPSYFIHTFSRPASPTYLTHLSDRVPRGER